MHSFKKQLHRALLLIILSGIWVSTTAWANDRDSLQKAHMEASVKLLNRAVTHNILKARTTAPQYLIDRLNYVSADTKAKIEQLQDLLKKQTGKALYVIITRSPDMLEEQNVATKFNQETKDFTDKVHAQSMLDENAVLLTINFVKSVKGKRIGIKTSYLQSTGLTVGNSLAQHKITENDFRTDLQTKATNLPTKDDYARALIYRVHQSLGGFAPEVALNNPSPEVIAKYEEVLNVGSGGVVAVTDMVLEAPKGKLLESRDVFTWQQSATLRISAKGVMTPNGKPIKISNDMNKSSLRFWASCNGGLLKFEANSVKYVAVISRPDGGSSCSSSARFLGYYNESEFKKLKQKEDLNGIALMVYKGGKKQLNDAHFKEQHWFKTAILPENEWLYAQLLEKPDQMDMAFVADNDKAAFMALAGDLSVTCRIDYYWKNNVGASDIDLTVKDKGLVNNTNYSKPQTGCGLYSLIKKAGEQDGLKEGWGTLVYAQHIDQVKNKPNGRKKLVTFANYLTNLLAKQALTIIDFEHKFEETGRHHTAGRTYLVMKRILAEGYTSETELAKKYTTLPGKIRDAFSDETYTVWATKTLTIPQGYNRYSKDYTNKLPKYQYSIQDLIVRHQYIAQNHTILSPEIVKAEKAGKAFPLSSPDVKTQYEALFGTNSAIFAWAKYAAGSAGAVKDEFCFYLRGFADELTSLIGKMEIPAHYWNPLCAKTKVGDCKACKEVYAPAFKNIFGMIEDRQLRTQLQEEFAFFAGVYNGMLGQLKGFTQMISLISGYFSDPQIRHQMAEAMRKLREKGIWKAVQEEYAKATCNNFVANYTQGKVLVDLLAIYAGAPKTINGFINFTGKQIDKLATKLAPTLTKLNLVAKKFSNKAVKLVKESGVFKVTKANKILAKLGADGKLELSRALGTQPVENLAALRARGDASPPMAARLPDGTEMDVVIYRQRTSAGEELKHCKPNGKRTCFVAGTLILTRTGYKKIEDIQVGDWVWSYNEQTGKRELKQVTKVFVRQTQQLVNLYLGNQLIQTTLEHPFRHQGKWVKANDLKAGDRLQLYQSSAQLALDSLARQDTSVTVYNFTVASNHNYFVGRQGVLVHNANGYDDLLARTNNQALKNKINALGDDKAKFLDDFKDVSDDVLAKFESKPGLVEAWKKTYHTGVNQTTRQKFLTEFSTHFRNIDEAVAFIKDKNNFQTPQSATQWRVLKQEFDIWTTAKKIEVNTNEMVLVTGRSKVYVDRGADQSSLLAHELDFTENKVAGFVGEDIVLPTRSTYPAIDGIYKTSGKPFSLKSKQNKLKGLNKTINGAYKDLITNNAKAREGVIYQGRVLDEWQGVDLHIDILFDTFPAKGGRTATVTKEGIKRFWSAAVNQNNIVVRNDGVISRIVVHLKNGDIVVLDMSILPVR